MPQSVNKKTFMGSCTSKFPLLVKAVFAVWLVLINSSAIANGKEYKTGEVYVIINSSSENLLQVFKIIEKQTSFSFAYDENDINLSKKLTLIAGQYLLKDLLNTLPLALVFAAVVVDLIENKKK